MINRFNSLSFQKIILWVLSILGQLSVMPYIIAVNVLAQDQSLFFLIFKTISLAAVLYGIIIQLSFFVLSKTNLQPFKQKSFINDSWYLSIVSGIIVGIILALSNFYTKEILPLPITITSYVAWTRLVGCLYGAINEEILCRLFLLPLIVFILNKIFKNKKYENKSCFIWISIIIIALVFAIGHLPAAFKIHPDISIVHIMYILALNSFAGIIFGWLFYRNGFWAAALSHLIAGIILSISLFL